MENKKQVYGNFDGKMRKEKSETHVFTKIPFAKDLSVKKEMFEKKSFVTGLLTEVFCTNRSSCSIYSG